MGAPPPAVWDARLFLTSQDGGDIVLLCVSTAGKELWRKKIAPATPVVRTDEGNGASASPCTDGKHVWAFASSGVLACFDLEGNPVWSADLQQRYGRFKTDFGMTATPLLHGDRLYLQLMHYLGSWVVCIDKLTGNDVWKVKRESDGRGECLCSYASPTLWQKGKDAYLITHGVDY